LLGMMLITLHGDALVIERANRVAHGLLADPIAGGPLDELAPLDCSGDSALSSIRGWRRRAGPWPRATAQRGRPTCV
jgi:hypothetical protein